MNLKNIGKRMLLDALATAPYTGGIAREWDSIENDRKFKKVEQEIAKIWEVVGKNPQQPLQGLILQLMGLLENNELVPDFSFRKAESCMAFLKEINTKSELGQENDPIIKYDECIRIAKNINTEDPEKELKLVVYELEKEDLIYKHADSSSPVGYCSIGPRKYFFCKTDSIFQDWNPKDDARAIVKLLVDNNEDSIVLGKLDEELKWGARRLNPAIAFLYLEELIRHDEELGGPRYVLHWMRLTEEACFFLEGDY